MRKVAALIVVLGLLAGCGGGGGGGKKKSPFPKEVADLLADIETAFKSGVGDLPHACGPGTISNPFELESTTATLLIATSGDAHAGSVAAVEAFITEVRNPDGSGLYVISAEDAADPTRVFYELIGQIRKPKIQFVAPPIGAKDFLAPDGTGQSFVIVQHEYVLDWTMIFENDPSGVGTGTLMNFSGPPGIPPVPDGIYTGRYTDKETWLFEFDITVPGSACLVGTKQIGDAETMARDGSGLPVSPLRHDHDVLAGVGEMAFANKHAVIIPVGIDAVSTWPVLDGDPLDVTNGMIAGGMPGYLPGMTDSSVDSASGAVILVDDGVAPALDGDFDDVDTYDLDFTLNIAGGPGGLNDGTVQYSVLLIDSSHEEDPTGETLEHPIMDEMLLYGEVSANTETGIVIFR